MWSGGFSSGASATRDLKEKKWDALVIGAGHDGLMAATCLALCGLSVVVLEPPPPLHHQSDVVKATLAADATIGSMESYAQRCFDLIDEYAPGFSSSVIGYDMLTPPDLEGEFGLTGSQITGRQLEGSHPGYGVMGACRRMLHVVLHDVKKHSR